jgi:small subunit ribosomal protein S8
MKCISKPSRRVFCSPEEARLICAQASRNSLLKNQQLGQITILNTPYGIIEMKQALEKGVGGEVLCYAK